MSSGSEATVINPENEPATDAVQYDYSKDLQTWVMGLIAIVEVEEIDSLRRIGSVDKADLSAQVELSDEASICNDTDSWNEPAFYHYEVEWKHEEEASSYGADICDEAETIVSTGDETDFKDRVATGIIVKAVYEKGDSDMVNCGLDLDGADDRSQRLAVTALRPRFVLHPQTILDTNEEEEEICKLKAWEHDALGLEEYETVRTQE
ncbi:hypothetical protein J4E80_010619 [Alternaria sp. BMP 0032]|nr:hypothetical protein J4E80_010619 [Alternaria sp. BMP 0032]